MGTCYYATVEHCDTCGRSDTHLIGKASCGWRFMFRGIEMGPMSIRSWDDWKYRLRKVDVCVRDEYGTQWPVEDFIGMVEAHFPDGKVSAEKVAGQSWVDENGYGFSSYEFS